MDHAKEARDYLQAAARDPGTADADIIATIGVGHALLAISAQLNAIARAAAGTSSRRPARSTRTPADAH